MQSEPAPNPTIKHSGISFYSNLQLSLLCRKKSLNTVKLLYNLQLEMALDGSTGTVTVASTVSVMSSK